MHPWLFGTPPLSTYGTCIVLAVLAGAWLARNLARRARVEPSHIDLLIPILVAAGWVGAWIFGLWTDWLTGSTVNGAVLVGAMLASTTAGIVYAKVNKIPLGILGDIFAAPVALVVAGGRVGCFFAGCCYGQVCSIETLGVHFPAGSLAFIDQHNRGLLANHAVESLAVYPVQLWESACCGLLAIALLAIFKRIHDGKGLHGEAFLALGIGYAVIRFIMELFRADNPPVAKSLTFSQCAVLGIAVLAVVTGWVRREAGHRWGLRRAQEDANKTGGMAVRSRQFSG